MNNTDNIQDERKTQSNQYKVIYHHNKREKCFIHIYIVRPRGFRITAYWRLKKSARNVPPSVSMQAPQDTHFWDHNFFHDAWLGLFITALFETPFPSCARCGSADYDPSMVRVTWCSTTRSSCFLGILERVSGKSIRRGGTNSMAYSFPSFKSPRFLSVRTSNVYLRTKEVSNLQTLQQWIQKGFQLSIFKTRAISQSAGRSRLRLATSCVEALKVDILMILRGLEF